LYASLDEIGAHWQRDRLFEPTMPPARREALYAGWQAAVKRIRSVA
jgi:glycerol kinase